MRNDLIVGLDIGSTAVRMAIGQRASPSDKSSLPGQRNPLHILGLVETPSEGISKGVITSIEDAVSSVSVCLEKAERLIGSPIESAWVGISGTYIICQESRGVVGISRADGEVGEEDIERAVEAARTVATPPNYEILHVIPKGFTIDGQLDIKDPLGMTGIRLEVDALIVQGLTSQIKNLTKCVYRTGLNIEDLVLGILATSEAVLAERQKELGVVSVNIGAATTSLVVFEEGDVLHTAVLPIGSEYITSDLALSLRISFDIAERLKKEQATCLPKEVSKREELNLRDFGAIDEEMVGRRYIAEVVEARVEEIFEKIDKELKKVERSGLLPAGVVLTGGGAKIHGIQDIAKKKLRLPATLGYPVELTSVSDKVNDLSFATALGLVVWGGGLREQKEGLWRAALSRFKVLNRAVKGIKSKLTRFK